MGWEHPTLAVGNECLGPERQDDGWEMYFFCAVRGALRKTNKWGIKTQRTAGVQQLLTIWGKTRPAIYRALANLTELPYVYLVSEKKLRTYHMSHLPLPRRARVWAKVVRDLPELVLDASERYIVKAVSKA